MTIPGYEHGTFVMRYCDDDRYTTAGQQVPTTLPKINASKNYYDIVKCPLFWT